jgi:hypothetical protein
MVGNLSQHKSVRSEDIYFGSPESPLSKMEVQTIGELFLVLVKSADTKCRKINEDRLFDILEIDIFLTA